MRAIIYDGRTYLDAEDVAGRVHASVTGLQAREILDGGYLLVADVVALPPTVDVAPVAECEAPVEESAPEAPAVAEPTPPSEPAKPVKAKRAR